MRIRTLLVLALAATSGFVALSCDDSTGVPPVYMITLTNPNDVDGAILFKIYGPVAAVTTSSSENVVIWSSLGTDEINAAVVGEIGNGPIAELELPATFDRDVYTLTVLEVADLDNELRTSLSGYSLELTR